MKFTRVTQRVNERLCGTPCVSIFGLSGPVDIRPLPGAWVAKLLGVILGSRTIKRSNFLCRVYLILGLKKLMLGFAKYLVLYCNRELYLFFSSTNKKCTDPGTCI